MLHSDLRAQFTFPHLCAQVKLIISGIIFIITISCLWSNFQHPSYKVNHNYDTMFHKHVRFALPVICTKETSTLFSQSFPNLCSACFHHLCVGGFVCATEGKHGLIPHIRHLFNMCIRFLHKERLTSTTSVTTSPSGEIHVSTSIKEQHRQKKELDWYLLIYADTQTLVYINAAATLAVILDDSPVT